MGFSFFYNNSAHCTFFARLELVTFMHEGEITLVLDTQKVNLKKGNFDVQRGTNHAWSNCKSKPAVVSIASHDAKYELG